MAARIIRWLEHNGKGTANFSRGVKVGGLIEVHLPTILMAEKLFLQDKILQLQNAKPCKPNKRQRDLVKALRKSMKKGEQAETVTLDMTATSREALAEIEKKLAKAPKILFVQTLLARNNYSSHEILVPAVLGNYDGNGVMIPGAYRFDAGKGLWSVSMAEFDDDFFASDLRLEVKLPLQSAEVFPAELPWPGEIIRVKEKCRSGNSYETAVLARIKNGDKISLIIETADTDNDNNEIHFSQKSGKWTMRNYHTCVVGGETPMMKVEVTAVN